MAGTDAPATRLDALREILVTAHELATKLARDPLAERILRAFAKLPERDREPILEIIERDTTWCRIAEQTSGQTGITVRRIPTRASTFTSSTRWMRHPSPCDETSS